MSENVLSLIDYEDVLVSDCSYLNIDDSVYYERDCSFLIPHLNIHSLPNKHNDLIDLMDVLNDKNMLPDILNNFYP